MSLKQFLQERVEHNNRVKLTVQQILDNLDDGHINYSKEQIKVNIGQIIKKSNLSNLYLVINNNSSEDFSVKLGKSKKNDGEYAIVVSTSKELPPRQEIDSFIAKDNELYTEICSNLEKYFNEHEDVNADVESETNYEKKKEHNNRDGFEERYNKLTSRLDKKIQEFTNMSQQLKNDRDNMNDEGKRQTIEMAIKHLQQDSVGDSYESFNKIANSYLDEDGDGFVKNLDKSLKDKLASRLESYYEQKIAKLK